MPFGLFCFYTGLGAFIWVTILTIIGWLVGREQEKLHEYMRSATIWVMLLVAVTIYVYIKLRARKRRAAERV